MNEYPIISSGERVGTLTVTRQGLLTVFDATAADGGEVFRLSVYGVGGEGYLGVMCPENGMLRLVKKLSRNAMAGFPGTIEYAAPAGEQPRPDFGAQPPQQQQRQPEPPQQQQRQPEPSQQQQRQSEPPQQQQRQQPERQEAQKEAREEAAETADAEETLWYSAPDGTLSTFDGQRLLIALPTDGISLPKGSEDKLRRINGREYIVFPR